MRLHITNQRQFDAALAEGKFATATVVQVWNCPGLTALPDLSVAKEVQVWGCPGLANAPRPRMAPGGVAYRDRVVWE